MLQKEVFEGFRELGWLIKRFDGERVCLKLFEDRSLRIVPQLRKMSDKQKLNTNPSVSTDKFSTFCSTISGRDKSGEPLVVDFSADAVFYSTEFSYDDLQQVSRRLSSWAISQNLDQAIKELIDLPTDATGAMPVRHLSALAISGDVAKLKHYQACFKAGDRLGFVPYVTKYYIDRAVALAEHNASTA